MVEARAAALAIRIVVDAFIVRMGNGRGSGDWRFKKEGR